MKKKALIATALIIVFILLAGMIVSLVSKGKAVNNAESDNENDSEIASSGEENSRIEGAEEFLDKNEESKAEKKKDTSDQESEGTGQESGASKGEDSSDSNSSVSGSGSGQGGSGGSGNSSDEANSDSAGQNDQAQSQQETPDQSSEDEIPDIPTIAFPYTISEEGLVIEQISPYNGYYIEDASDKEVSGVAAIVVTNNGGDLEFAGIGISQGERSLAFSASQIPAGATVIIQEQTGASYSSSEPYYSATATTRRAEHFEMSEELVTVEDTGNNTLSVTNISGLVLSEVKVFFKNYLSEEDIYVGGITYSVTLKDVEPDTVTEVSAGHYDSQYSRVVEVSVR